MRRSRLSFVFLPSVATLASGCSYNKLQTLDEQINAAQGQIKVQLQRRADLIPNLVAAVKGVTKQEDTRVQPRLPRPARSWRARRAVTMSPPWAKANAAMSAPLGRLLALSENYPTLRSSESFKALMDELSGTENRIAVARTRTTTGQ